MNQNKGVIFPKVIEITFMYSINQTHKNVIPKYLLWFTMRDVTASSVGLWLYKAVLAQIASLLQPRQDYSLCDKQDKN